ncbi:MAG: hypothetical protein ACK2U5_23590 [Candidatus Promineifilaceae bacterium]|jgi:hypothetical protein
MQKKLFLMLVVIMMLVLMLGVFGGTAAAAPGAKACWGQASAVFAQTGEMGAHSSSQANPRMGLHNLAVALYDAGVIPEASLSALGVFVATELGLSIDACGT